MKRAVAILVGLVVLLLPAPALADFGSPQTISVAGQSTDDPQVALDAQGNAIAVWTQGADHRIMAAFAPAGASFGPAEAISDPDSYTARIAVDAQGDAIVAWAHSDGLEFRVQAAFRPAGGGFGSPQTISPPYGYSTQPAVAVDPQGNAFVVWSSEIEAQCIPNVLPTNSCFRIVAGAAYRPKAAGAFGPPQTLSTESRVLTENFPRTPSVGVDGLGRAVAVWSDGRNIMRTSSDAAGVFGPPQSIAGAGFDREALWNPEVAVDPQGDAIAVWLYERQAVASYDFEEVSIRAAHRYAGQEFIAPERISALDAFSFHPKVAIDARGNGIVVWAHGDTLCCAQEIQAAFWGSGGFGTPRAVANCCTAAAGCCNVASPAVGVGASGDAVAVWREWTGGTYGLNADSMGVQAAFRPPGGSFGAAQTVFAGPPPFRVDFEPELAVDSRGEAVVVWQGTDGRNDRVKAAFHPTTPDFADVAVSQSVSADPAPIGEPLSYTIRVENNGPKTATGVVVSDRLARGLRFRSARTDSGSCAQRTIGKIVCWLSDLGSGDTATVTLVVRPIRYGTLANTVSVTANQPPDSNTANNTSSQSTTVSR